MFVEFDRHRELCNSTSSTAYSRVAAAIGAKVSALSAADPPRAPESDGTLSPPREPDLSGKPQDSTRPTVAEPSPNAESANGPIDTNDANNTKAGANGDSSKPPSMEDKKASPEGCDGATTTPLPIVSDDARSEPAVEDPHDDMPPSKSKFDIEEGEIDEEEAPVPTGQQPQVDAEVDAEVEEGQASPTSPTPPNPLPVVRQEQDGRDFVQGSSRDSISVEEQCRRELIPLISMIIMKRGGEDQAKLDGMVAQAAKNLTDEQCRQFMDLAKKVASQLRQRELSSLESSKRAYANEDGGDKTKRSRDSDQESATANTKRQRLGHEAGSHSVSAASSPTFGSVSSVTLVDKPGRGETGSPSVKSPPTAPRAMRNAKLASAQTYRGFNTKPSGVPQQRDSPAQSIGSGGQQNDTTSTQLSPSLHRRHSSRQLSPLRTENNGNGPLNERRATPHGGVTIHADKGSAAEVGFPTRIKGEISSPHTSTSHSRTPAGNDVWTSVQSSAAADARTLDINPPPSTTGPSDSPTDMGLPAFSRDDTEVVPPPPPEPVRIPGLWNVTIGEQARKIVTLQFAVDAPTAAAIQRWNARRERFDPNERYIAVHLLCLPAKEVSALNQRVGEGMMPSTPEAIAHGVWRVKSTWPARGTLMLQMNEGQPEERVWFPEHLHASLHLDISEAVRPGINALQVIQLDDMSPFVFVVHASDPFAQKILDDAVAPASPFGDMFARLAANNGVFTFP